MKCRSLSFMWLFWSWRSFEKSVIDDTVGASGESEDMGDELMFVVVHAVVPVVEIFKSKNRAQHHHDMTMRWMWLTLLYCMGNNVNQHFDSLSRGSMFA